MKNILFICHGNIIRSPMAQFIFKNIIHNNKNDWKYQVDSKATSTEELGNSMDYRTIGILNKYNIPYDKHYSSQITKYDYLNYDYLIIMDENNLRNIKRIVGDDKDKKIFKLLSFIPSYSHDDVLDPWYTHDFESCYKDIQNGCQALYNFLENHQ